MIGKSSYLSLSSCGTEKSLIIMIESFRVFMYRELYSSFGWKLWDPNWTFFFRNDRRRSSSIIKIKRKCYKKSFTSTIGCRGRMCTRAHVPNQVPTAQTHATEREVEHRTGRRYARPLATEPTTLPRSGDSKKRRPHEGRDAEWRRRRPSKDWTRFSPRAPCRGRRGTSIVPSGGLPRLKA